MRSKIKFITDSASDIPDEDLKRLNIDMLCFPIAVDGIEYTERQDFSFHEYYKILENAKEIPKTSRINEEKFVNSYKKAFSQGYEAAVAITINGSGSSTFESACAAKNMFFQEVPEAKGCIQIEVVNSQTYTIAYGWAVMEAAEKAEKGEELNNILEFLDDWFYSTEIYAGCYTLKYAQKSGRVRLTTAFVGEMLGMRPIISLIGDKTNTVNKIRGDKNIPSALIDVYRKAGVSQTKQVLIVHGAGEEPAKALQRLFQKEFKISPPLYNGGAAIVTNIGPEVLAIVFQGEKREASNK